MQPVRTGPPTASSPAASVRFTFSCPVRWDDMDAFGHVNNVTFLTYMQEARTGMLFAGEAAEHIPDLIKGVVVARHEIDYRRPLEWRPEPIEVDVWTAQVKSSSFKRSRVPWLYGCRQKWATAVTCMPPLWGRCSSPACRIRTSCVIYASKASPY